AAPIAPLLCLRSLGKCPCAENRKSKNGPCLFTFVPCKIRGSPPAATNVFASSVRNQGLKISGGRPWCVPPYFLQLAWMALRLVRSASGSGVTLVICCQVRGCSSCILLINPIDCSRDFANAAASLWVFG